jgi:hypothetical protein
MKIARIEAFPLNDPEWHDMQLNTIGSSASSLVVDRGALLCL